MSARELFLVASVRGDRLTLQDPKAAAKFRVGDKVRAVPTMDGLPRRGQVVLVAVDEIGGTLTAAEPWDAAIPAFLAVFDLIAIEPSVDERATVDEMRRAELREDVAVMRELGVTEWGAIRLGPVSVVHAKRPDPPTPEEAAKRKAADDKRALFAASGFMPKDET